MKIILMGIAAVNLLCVAANIACIFAWLPGSTGDTPVQNGAVAACNLVAAAWCVFVSKATAQHPTPAKESDE